jgi:hypothetical protein
MDNLVRTMAAAVAGQNDADRQPQTEPNAHALSSKRLRCLLYRPIASGCAAFFDFSGGDGKRKKMAKTAATEKVANEGKDRS